MQLTALWWWIDRWRKSSAYMDMTLEEQGAYRNLLDEAHLRGGALPADERILAKACGDALAWARVRTSVMARFTKQPDGWHNLTLDSILHESVRRATNQANYRARHNNGRDNGADNGRVNAPDNNYHNNPASPSPSPSLISGSGSVSRTKNARDAGKPKKTNPGEPVDGPPLDVWLREFTALYPGQARCASHLTETAFYAVVTAPGSQHANWAALKTRLEGHLLSEQWRKGKIPRLDRYLRDGLHLQELPEPGVQASAQGSGPRRGSAEIGSSAFQPRAEFECPHLEAEAHTNAAACLLACHLGRPRKDGQPVRRWTEADAREGFTGLVGG